EWCPACWDEHEDLMWLANEKGVRIVGLNYKDEREKAFSFLDRLGDPYQTIIYDPRGSLGFDLGVYGAPETFVIDAEGVVRYRHVGVVSERVWEEILLPVINRVDGKSWCDLCPSFLWQCGCLPRLHTHRARRRNSTISTPRLRNS